MPKPRLARFRRTAIFTNAKRCTALLLIERCADHVGEVEETGKRRGRDEKIAEMSTQRFVSTNLKGAVDTAMHHSLHLHLDVSQGARAEGLLAALVAAGGDVDAYRNSQRHLLPPRTFAPLQGWGLKGLAAAPATEAVAVAAVEEDIAGVDIDAVLTQARLPVLVHARARATLDRLFSTRAALAGGAPSQARTLRIIADVVGLWALTDSLSPLRITATPVAMTHDVSIDEGLGFVPCPWLLALLQQQKTVWLSGTAARTDVVAAAFVAEAITDHSNDGLVLVPLRQGVGAYRDPKSAEPIATRVVCCAVPPLLSIPAARSETVLQLDADVPVSHDDAFVRDSLLPLVKDPQVRRHAHPPRLSVRLRFSSAQLDAVKRALWSLGAVQVTTSSVVIHHAAVEEVTVSVTRGKKLSHVRIRLVHASDTEDRVVWIELLNDDVQQAARSLSLPEVRVRSLALAQLDAWRPAKDDPA